MFTVFRYSGHKNESYQIKNCFSNDDAQVVSGSEDYKILLWDLVEGTLLNSLSGHNGAVTNVIFHPRDQVIVSSDVVGDIKLWEKR